ncbi:MAG: hypothetical protein JW993_19985 [Sedimentisphaerales bacterium]|nr:hypothetical protein [Sedimentisphaerales bacterium]
MSQHLHHRTGRRAFLKAAGGIAGALALGSRTWATRLILVATGQTNPISQVEWIVYDTGLQDAAGDPVHRCAIRITTTAGAQGWADFDGWTAPDGPTARLIKDMLLGRELTEHESLWHQLYQQGIPLGTLGAVDVALWDLKGRIEGQPICALLGAKRQQVAGCVSTGFNLGGPLEYANFASACKEQSAHGVKIQTAAGKPEQDIAVYGAVREAVGSDFACIAGGAAAYTYEQALQVGQELDELDYAWFQSPMPENDEWVARYVALTGALETPVCAPETERGSYQSRVTWVERAACDIPCIDVHYGGLTACVELAQACESKGIRLELNNVGPDAYAHLQLLGATDETLIEHVEMLSLSSMGVPPMNHGHDARATLPGRVSAEPALNEQGYIAIGQAPGMGLELDWKYIFTHRVS